VRLLDRLNRHIDLKYRDYRSGVRGDRSDRGDGAPLPPPGERSVVTLFERRSWGCTKGVMPTLRDGAEIPPADVATYLERLLKNRVSAVRAQ